MTTENMILKHASVPYYSDQFDEHFNFPAQRPAQRIQTTMICKMNVKLFCSLIGSEYITLIKNRDIIIPLYEQNPELLDELMDCDFTIDNPFRMGGGFDNAVDRNTMVGVFHMLKELQKEMWAENNTYIIK
jgi:hypothetical protein